MVDETKQLEICKAEVDELVHPANILTIASAEENAVATEYKAKLNLLGKRIKQEKESATKPINEALRRIRSWWDPLEDKVSAEDDRVGVLLLTYKRAVEDEARKKEAQIAARVEKGTMRLDTAEKKIDALPQIQKTTHTTAGQVQFRKIPQMRIVDESLIPDNYWVIDQVSLRRDVIAGVVVPGAEKYYEERV